MSPQHPDLRGLTVAESAVLRRALDLADFEGRSELCGQVPQVSVTGGSRFVLDLVVPEEVVPSVARSGPIPTRVLVLGEFESPGVVGIGSTVR